MRPTPERLAEIRYRATCGSWSAGARLIADELLAELDAVTRERDEARAALRQVVVACTDRTNGFGLLSRALDAAAAVLGAA
jgi:hypothetical protein